MGRLFSCIFLSMLLLPGIKGMDDAQPVFFSMLFPQLMPHVQQKTTESEAVFL